ncbi:DDE superfamily endonuclease [Popillia japonica]|uniref:DDE superfamily endonuclease n=1 Tax=Popillia japonica TaxID=7064 RepID=A0AAW1N0U8_POPJA
MHTSRDQYLILKRESDAEFSSTGFLYLFIAERQKLNAIVKTENIDSLKLYNYDETELYWRVLPNNTQASTAERNTPDRTTIKDRVSVSLCANADGSRMLKSVIVGKSKKPFAIKKILWTRCQFTSITQKVYGSLQRIQMDWFKKYAVPEIRRYQAHILKIPEYEVKALDLLDNCPAHPQAEQLVSDDEKISQASIQKEVLSKILEIEEPAVGEKDRRGQKTLQNLKVYYIRSMIFNLASAVNDIHKPSTLINSWQKLLINEEVESDTGGFETEDFYNTPYQAGEN